MNNTNDQEKNNEEDQNLEIDDLLEGFEGGNLNLTNEDKDEGDEEDEETMKKIKDEYEKFMKEMQGGGSEEPNMDLGMGNMGKAFEDLFKGLIDNDQAGEEIGKKFESMFKNLDSPEGFENAASELLNEFMDKNLLEEPLKETKENYEKFFEEQNKGKKEISENFKKQYDIIISLLEVLEKEPSNKNKMIGLFNELQSAGAPPEGVSPGFGNLF